MIKKIFAGLKKEKLQDFLPIRQRKRDIAGLNRNNTAKPDKPVKPTAKQKCFPKLFHAKHIY